MKKAIEAIHPRRILAMLLCITILAGSMGFTAFAEESPAEPDSQAAFSEEEGDEALAEAPEEADDSLAEAPEEASPGELPEGETAPEEPEEVPEEAPAEEDAPEEAEIPEDASEETQDASSDRPEDEAEKENGALPCGFRGMPEDYELSEKERNAKRALTEMGTLEAILLGTAAYVEDEVLCRADSEAYARLVAEAYSAELLDFSGYSARLRLTTATVAEAVTCAADMDCPLPTVEPNWLISVGPAYDLNDPGLDVRPQSAYSGRMWQDWINWITSMGGIPDVCLADPAGDYQYHHDLIGSYAAWSVTTGSPDILVAVIDTGVDYRHPDLAGRVVGGWDFIENDSDPSDGNGHGTHVAGIVAASMGNGVAGGGVAPGVSLLAVRTMDEKGSGSNYAIARGIDYAVGQGADILNMSLGGVAYSTAMEDAVRRAYEAGVTVIAAMGNEGTNHLVYPAGLDHVVTVGASNIGGRRASYSNYGAWCDITAPGTKIWSTENGGGYVQMSGTSMATPVVAGAAALYMSRFGNPGPDAMEKILKKAVTGSAGAGMGAGILDVTKLFGKIKAAPLLNAHSAGGSLMADARVPNDGYLTVESADGNTTGDTRFICTADGTDPSVRNGVVINGTEISEMGSFDAEKGAYVLPLSAYLPGGVVCFRVIEVNGNGIAGELSELKLLIQEAESAEEQTGETVGDPEKPPAGSEDQDAGKVGEDSGKPSEGSVTGREGEIQSISITGPSLVGRGCSVSYKTVAVESLNPKNRKVHWVVESEAAGSPAPEGIRCDAGTGKVTVAKSVPAGTVFYISAEPADGTGSCRSGWIRVTVDEKAGGISIAAPGKPLFTVDLPHTEEADNRASVTATREGGALFPSEGIVWSSSRPDIVSVSDDGQGGAELLGLRAGTAVLTARTTDGSGKTARINVRITVPASSVTVISKSSSLRGDLGSLPLAYGRTVGNLVTLGSTYGTPSVKKLTWRWMLYTKDAGGAFVPNPELTDAARRYISLSSTGSLTLKASGEKILGYDYRIFVFAGTTDGTGLEASTNYYPTPALKTLQLLGEDGKPVKTVTLYTKDGQQALSYRIAYSYRQQGEGEPGTLQYSVRSSNPAVAGAQISMDTLMIATPGNVKAGTATITVFAGDGSNRSVSLTVKVVNNGKYETSAYTRTVTTGDTTIPIRSPHDHAELTFIPSENASYTLTSRGPYDTRVWLLDEAGGILAEDDDSGEGRNFSLSYAFRANIPYTIWIEAEQGSFTLRITQDLPTVLSPGENTVEIHDAGSAVWVRFAPPATGSFTLCSTGSAGNPWCKLYDAQGNCIAEAGDGGEGKNFSLTQSLSAGYVYFYLIGLEGAETGTVPLLLSADP